MVVGSTSKSSGGHPEIRELELRLERETAVLLDRLDLQSEELEKIELELATARAERDQAQARTRELEVELSDLGLQLAQQVDAHRAVLASLSWRVTKPLRWTKRKTRRVGR